MQLVILIAKALLTIPADLLGLVVVPIALMFTSKPSHHLPHLFWLWCNEHDSINGYSNTDHWEKRWGTPPRSGVRGYLPRFIWLAIRNRSTNFRRLLGVKELGDRLNIRYPIRIWPGRYLVFKLGYTHGKPGTIWYNHRSDRHHFVFSLDSRSKP